MVFAAASLRETFTDMARDFEQTHPRVRLSFNFAGTQELRTQLEHGARADVFASADLRHMEALVRAGRVAEDWVFARNEPVLVISKEAKAMVRSLADLPKLDRIIVGTPEVPIGRYTAQILERASESLGPDFRARVEARVVSRESNVRQVLTKVRLGEAQAGFVYRTDVSPEQDEVAVITLPAASNVVAAYPIALVKGAHHPQLARAWILLLRSNAGQRALARAGFLPATAGGAP